MTPTENRIPEIPAELVEAFRTPPSRVILLVGAGISRRVKRENGCAFPSWVELLRELLHWARSQGFSFTQEQLTALEALIRRGDSASLIHVAGWLKDYVGKPLLSEFMLKTFCTQPKAASPTHALLRNLPFRGLVTFNYDSLLETYLQLPPFAIATQDDEEKLSQILRGQLGLFLLKAHGDAGRSTTLVFGHDDYRRIIMQNEAYRKVLTTLFAQNVVLSVGFGLDDPDLEYLYDQVLATLPSAPLKVFALIRKGRINAVFRDIWLRQRKLRLLEYEASTPDHNEVDEFLRKLAGAIKPTTEREIIATSADSGTFSPFLNAMRGRLARSWGQIGRRFANSSDAYALARERARIIDEFIKELLEESLRHTPMVAEGFAVIARGGYGRGHLSSNSDIDITLLHSAARKEEAAKLFEHFLLLLRDTVKKVDLNALPIVNTIEECRDHWRNLDSLVSFTFSRLIVGDFNLHSNLRMTWREHVKIAPLNEFTKRIRSDRLCLQVEECQRRHLNIKKCAGGILEIMLGNFLEEVLGIKMGEVSGRSTSNDELDIAIGQLLQLREDAFRASRTLVLDAMETSGKLCYEDWCQLTKNRLLVRDRLITSLSRLESVMEGKAA